MNELSSDAFCALSGQSQVQYLADLCNEIEGQWENRSERVRLLLHLRERLVKLDYSPESEQRFLFRLLPQIRRNLDRNEFQAIRTPTLRCQERLHGTLGYAQDSKEKKGEPLELTLVLDNLRSAFNVGAIFRTAESLGVRKIYLCGYTATPENRKVGRAAMGTEKTVPWEWKSSTDQVVQSLRDTGLTAYGLEEGGDPIFEVALQMPAVLVLGNERFGLSQSVLKRCGQRLSIPMYGQKNSLNVASAFAVAGYCFRRRGARVEQ